MNWRRRHDRRCRRRSLPAYCRRLQRAKARHGQGRGHAGRPHRRHFTACSRRLFRRHGSRLQARERPDVKPLDIDAVRGRNTWIVWTGGNDRFWDYMANNTFGAFDLSRYCRPTRMSAIASIRGGMAIVRRVAIQPEIARLSAIRHGLAHGSTPSRSNRFDWYGLINEPCFEQATGPDEYGLWLDSRARRTAPSPIRSTIREEISRRKDPRARHDHAGRLLLRQADRRRRLAAVSQSRFRRSGQGKMDGGAPKISRDGFYTDKDFYNNKHLVRPYRVGMSCGFCHVGPSPTNPPQATRKIRPGPI